MQRSMAWPNCVNARDLGGLPTPSGGTHPGWLYRSDTLTRLSPEGLAAVRDAGVTTVIDLRDTPLCRRFAHAFTEPRVVALPLVPDDFPLPVPLEGGYVRALDAAVDRVGPIASAVADAPGGVVFHCHSGTGRTGVLAALLLAFAEVPDELIAEDYLLSLRSESAPLGDVEAASRVVPDLLKHLTRVHGSADAYLERAGVDARTRQRLRVRLSQ